MHMHCHIPHHAQAVDDMERMIPALLIEPKSKAEVNILLRKQGIDTAMIDLALKRLKVNGIVEETDGLWRIA